MRRPDGHKLDWNMLKNERNLNDHPLGMKWNLCDNTDKNLHETSMEIEGKCNENGMKVDWGHEWCFWLKLHENWREMKQYLHIIMYEHWNKIWEEIERTLNENWMGMTWMKFNWALVPQWWLDRIFPVHWLRFLNWEWDLEIHSTRPTSWLQSLIQQRKEEHILHKTPKSIQVRLYCLLPGTFQITTQHVTPRFSCIALITWTQERTSQCEKNLWVCLSVDLQFLAKMWDLWGVRPRVLGAKKCGKWPAQTGGWNLIRSLTRVNSGRNKNKSTCQLFCPSASLSVYRYPCRLVHLPMWWTVFRPVYLSGAYKWLCRFVRLAVSRPGCLCL